MNRDYDIAIIERPLDDALTRSEVIDLLDFFGDRGVIPVKFDNAADSSTAMGFIALDAAKRIGYMYQPDSQIGGYIGEVLADVENENDDNDYEATAENGEKVRIWITR